MGQRVLPQLNFERRSWLLIFTKIRYSWISHANLARWWRSSKISSSTVVDQLQQNCISRSDSVLNSNYSWIFLSYKKNLIDDLLTISVTFTWFYKTGNIVMLQIEIDFGSHHTSWNISSAILKTLLFFKAWLNSY